jgi:hypothetical protein
MLTLSLCAEFTATSGGTEYAAGSLIDSMTGWSDELRSRVLGGNALDWLGLDSRTFARDHER